MSHVATVDVEIKDLDALEAACQKLGLELCRGQQTYRWYGTHVGDYPLPEGFSREELGTCAHAIRFPPGHERHGQAYEIGVVKRRDHRPGYCLMWDFFNGGYGLEEVVGADCKTLRQSYAHQVARQAAARQGFSISEQVQADGSIVMKLRK